MPVPVPVPVLFSENVCKIIEILNHKECTKTVHGNIGELIGGIRFREK